MAPSLKIYDIVGRDKYLEDVRDYWTIVVAQDESEARKLTEAIGVNIISVSLEPRRTYIGEPKLLAVVPLKARTFR